MTVTENQLPTDGVLGRLTDEQHDKLKEFWSRFWKLIDDAPETGSADPQNANGGGGDKVDEKKPGKDIPKDDKAKEAARAEQEMKDANAALEKYGSKRFLETYWKFIAMDNPDVMMLRFCRARKWDSGAGVAMLAACMKWRMEGDVEKIIYKGEEGMRDAEGFLKQLEIGKTFCQGTDRRGRPVIYIHVRKHKTFDQSAKALEDFVLYQMGSVRCMFAGEVDKVTMIFNMVGFGLSNMDWRCVLFIVKCLEAYYPESLNCILIHSAPWVFQGIWKILAPMLDPVVRAKVQMTKNSEDLKVHIAPEHLIKELGGESDWEWQYDTIVDGENELQSDKSGKKRATAERQRLIDAYSKVCRKWTKSDDEVTSVTRDLLAAQLRQQYFELDPYIRGRGIYHRHGNIVGNGLVMFEYPGLQPEGEWEVRGYGNCREELELEVKRLAALVRDKGGKVPELGGSGGGGGSDDDMSEDEAPKKRKSSSRRKSRSD